jgi:hypothetical protein
MAFTEKYVTVNGGGLHDGSSEANAWTLDEAYANQAAGQRWNVKAGTYTLTQVYTTWTNGTQSAPFSVRGYKTTAGDLDNRPTSQLVDGTDIPLIQNSNSSYYFYPTCDFSIWENISFKSTTSRPAIYTYFQNGSLRRCRFNTTTSTNVVANRYPYKKFVECYFTNPSATSSIINLDAVTFVGCVFDQIYGVSASESSGFLNCIFKNISNNAIEMGAWGEKDIIGNTFYNVTGDAIYVASSTMPLLGASLVANNVFHTITGDAIKAFSTTNLQLIAQNNLFYNVTGSNFANDGFGMSRDEFTDLADPFTDAAGGDFSLVSGSNGYSNAAPKPYEVFDVNSRRDIGAIQHADPSGGGGSTFHPLG